MKKILFLGIVFFSLVLCFCSKNNVSENNYEDGVNFYFLKDSTLTAKDVSNENIYNLKLAAVPFLTYQDFEFYNWSDHSFSISLTKANSIGKICESNPTTSGIPFILTVDNERIYLGAFWFMFSSSVPTFPYIDATFKYETDPTIFMINKTWIDTEQDFRNDPRIYNSLKKYDLLTE